MEAPEQLIVKRRAQVRKLFEVLVHHGLRERAGAGCTENHPGQGVDAQRSAKGLRDVGAGRHYAVTAEDATTTARCVLLDQTRSQSEGSDGTGTVSRLEARRGVHSRLCRRDRAKHVECAGAFGIP